MTQAYKTKGPSILSDERVMQFSPEEIMELMKSYRDPVYFCNQYCYAITLDKGLTRVNLFPYQETIIKATITNSFTIAKLPRQSGKTQCVALLVLWLALFNDAYTIGIVAQNEKTAKGILKRVKTAYENLPDFLRQEATAWNETSIGFANGSSIAVSGTSSASARGGSYNFFYLDEFAFVPEHIQKEFYMSTMPTIAAGKTGKVLITSTPCGLNLFWKIWTDSEKGINDFKRIAIEWNDVPGRDEEWRLKQVRLMGQEGFDQEFNTEFLGSSHTLISGKILNLIKNSYETPIHKHDGLSIYYPPANNRSYILIADVARGVGLDFSAFSVIDVTEWPLKVVATYKNNKIHSINYAQVIHNVAKNYNQCYCLVEVNDIGQEIVDILFEEYEYTNLFAHNTKNRNKQVQACFAEDPGAMLGVRTSRLVKRIGCNNIKNLIENHKIKLTDADLIMQFSRFVQVNKSYEAEDGNDDLVMTMVLFGWLQDTKLFKDLIEKNFRREHLMGVQEKTKDDMAVFGFFSEDLENWETVQPPPQSGPISFDNWIHNDWGEAYDMNEYWEKQSDPETQHYVGASDYMDAIEAQRRANVRRYEDFVINSENIHKFRNQ